MLGEDLAVALCQVDFLEVVVAYLVSLVQDLVGLAGLEHLEEDWVCTLVVLGEYQVIDLVDLVDGMYPDLPTDLWVLQVVLPLMVPNEC